MKKILLLLTLTLYIFSCSSDDDSNSGNANTNLELLTNQWFFIKSQDLNLPEGQQEYLANECEQNRFIQFNSNGTYLESFYYQHPNDGCINDGNINGTFELTNLTNLKLIENDNQVYVYEIKTINSNQLSIEYLEDNEIYTYEK